MGLSIMWIARGECGTKKVLNIYNVILGYTKSCGCLQKRNNMKVILDMV